jgi:hypothetical protein
MLAGHPLICYRALTLCKRARCYGLGVAKRRTESNCYPRHDIY